MQTDFATMLRTFARVVLVVSLFAPYLASGVLPMVRDATHAVAHRAMDARSGSVDALPREAAGLRSAPGDSDSSRHAHPRSEPSAPAHRHSHATDPEQSHPSDSSGRSDSSFQDPSEHGHGGLAGLLIKVAGVTAADTELHSEGPRFRLGIDLHVPTALEPAPLGSPLVLRALAASWVRPFWTIPAPPVPPPKNLRRV